jgi:hypothetical protein
MIVMDADFLRAMNVVVMAAMIAVFTVLVIVGGSNTSAYARADRFSQRSRLPYGTEQTRESVVRHMRSAGRAGTIAALIGTLWASCLLLTPLATSPVFVFVAVLPVLILTGAVSAAVSVRERLFQPAPSAPRIARARALGVADYLDPFRRLLPWMLAPAAAVCLTAVCISVTRHPDRLDGVLVFSLLIVSIVALATFVAVPILERMVLEQPQPATDTLELAWDDAFRATTLGQLRLALAFAAWIVLALSAGVLWPGSDGSFGGFALQVPTWGIIALQFVYPNTGRRLPHDLYPDWLRGPVARERSTA